MKLHLSPACPWPQGYSNHAVSGWMPGEVRPVSPEVGGYLLSTFPEHFLEVAAEAEPEGPAEGESAPPPKRRKGG